MQLRTLLSVHNAFSKEQMAYWVLLIRALKIGSAIMHAV